MEEEARLRLEEEIAAEKAREKQERLRTLLEEGGFPSSFRAVNERKKVKKTGVKALLPTSSSGFCFPLHFAVEQRDLEFVNLLLEFGADRYLENSAKQIPCQLAMAKNKQGSHAEIIAALSA